MLKRLAQSPAIPWLGGTLLWLYMLALCRTLRWRVEGLDKLREAWEAPRPFVLAVWHSRIMLMAYVPEIGSRGWRPPPIPMSIMVSNSRDGEFTQRTSSLFGLNVIRGSAANTRKKNKNKRGVPAAREALRVMNDGGSMMVTIDGPNGPAETVGIGAVKLAQQMDASIFAYGLSSTGRRLKTWDRLLAPPLFARAAVVIGEPIRASKNMDSEVLRLEVERSLKAATARADLLAGRQPEAAAAPATQTKTSHAHDRKTTDTATGRGAP